MRTRSRDQPEVVLSALRAAAERLDVVDGAVVDQLFVLEGVIRAGRIAAPVRERLRRVQHDSAWRAEHAWVADVPRAAELAQLACVLEASGTDIPALWATRLGVACDRLAKRRARFGPATDVGLLATLIRGLHAVRRPVTQGFLASVADVLAEPGTPYALYELSEALARHDDQRGLAERVAQRAFSSGAMDPADAVARWWLADRWKVLTGGALSVPPSLLDAARRQSLTISTGSEVRVLGMTIEVMGRASEDLVIGTAQEMSARATRRDRRRDAEIFAWRFFIPAGVLIAVLVNAGRLLAWVQGHDPERLLLQTFAGVLCAAAAWATLRGCLRIARVAGLDVGDIERFVDVVVPLVAGVAGGLLYP